MAIGTARVLKFADFVATPKVNKNEKNTHTKIAFDQADERESKENN